jgi:hypothetical protein
MRLPRTEVEIYYDLDRDALPTSGVTGLGPGRVLNRDYTSDIIIEASWELAREALDNERAVLGEAAAAASDMVELENLLVEEPSYFGLELGIEAACIALCAAGCSTAISCRGHDYEGAWARCPMVIFSADAQRAAIVEEIARASGCGLISNKSGDLELWASSVEEMWQFQELLLARRNELDALPDSDALREARASARK